MGKRLLTLSGETIVLVLLLAAPAAEAGPLYQSDLACNSRTSPHGSGLTVVKSNGDLYVRLQGLESTGTVQCTIFCNVAGVGTSHVASSCGGRVIGPGGNLTTIAPRESFVPPLSAAFGSLCTFPLVEVLAPDDNCVSGFDTSP